MNTTEAHSHQKHSKQITAIIVCVVWSRNKQQIPDNNYLHKDYQGSIMAITAESGTVRHKRYDPWGVRKDPVTWDTDFSGGLTDRGYTMHEHLDDFKLINMNGRIYDPVLGRFLSPDNHIQAPGNPQNYNRYAYALNNPLKYTDPSGEFPIIPIMAAAFLHTSVRIASGNVNSHAGFFGSIAVGAAMGYATHGIGELFRPVGSAGFSGEIGRSLAHGVSNTLFSGISGHNGNPISTLATGGLGSLGGSAFMMYGGKFSSSPLGVYGFSALSGGLASELTGGEFWRGAAMGTLNAGLNHLQQGIKRPKFEELLDNYPTDGNGNNLPSEEVYELIGGQALSEYKRDPHAYRNACALRTSRALNYSGTEIPRINGKTLVGADGHNYFYRASDLYKWMSKSAVFGAPNISTSNASKLLGSKGVFIMQAHYPANFGAWGHATLYNINGCIGSCYIGDYAYKYNLWKF